MCRVSNKLKLCTCNADINTLKNYWVLHRFIKGKKDYIVGELTLPNYLDPEDDGHNRKLLPQLLNERNTWDIDITPKHKDRLLLSFTTEQDREFHYGFEYRKSRWVECQYDGIEWHWHHDMTESGEISQ